MSIEKLNLTSPDLVNQNIKKLAALFPNCVTEGANGKAIDFDLLKQELNNEVIEGNKERYRLEWPGKREAIVTANLPTTKTLRPVREDSVDFDNTENLYIEGDNLEVLKLLQESYLGKIKMIYIDPPYNTGKDFVYKDNFSKATQEELIESGQKDEYNQRLVSNPETAGRYHSDWLSMMYPRLKLARNLLKENGVIFISIDDHEVHNLRKICDDIFGDNNFVDCLKWKRKKQPSFLAKHTAKVMEYVLIYSKNASDLEKLSIEGTSDTTKKVINISNNETTRDFKAGVRIKKDGSGVIEKGRYTIRTMDVEYDRDVHYSNGLTMNEVNVTSRFSTSQTNIDKYIENNLLFITSNLGLRRDVGPEELGKRKSITDLLLKDWGDNQESDNELRAIFGTTEYFDYTKPLSLIKNLICSNFCENEIVLDFFSGSSTTAHSVFEANKDNGNRKFIMVQLSEKIEEQSKAFLDGYKSICEIGKERIRRAGKKIKEETNADIDYGFRVYKLDESNMQDVYYKPQEYNQTQLDAFADNVKADRTADDLLAQVMLDWGLPLSLKIEQASINGKQVLKVAENSLFACFDNGIDEDFAKEIAKEAPLRIVFKDSGFENDTAKVNVKQLLKQLSPETEMKVI
jgi:adenine-specific DNA-methyltransferase